MNSKLISMIKSYLENFINLLLRQNFKRIISTDIYWNLIKYFIKYINILKESFIDKFFQSTQDLSSNSIYPNEKQNIKLSKGNNISEAINEAFDNIEYNENTEINKINENEIEETIPNKRTVLSYIFSINPSSLFLILIISLFVGVGFWATLTELSEVIRCSGQVIPVSKAKVVQSEFQGKVSNINVKVGDVVKKGDILLVLNDSDFVTEININKEDYFSSLALIERLEGESEFRKPVFSIDLIDKRRDLMSAQLQIYNSRINKLKDDEKLLKNELERLIYNIEEVKADIRSATEERKFLDEELQIISPLVKKGFEPRLKLIQISQRLAALDSKILKSKVAIPGIQIDVRKVSQRLNNLKMTCVRIEKPCPVPERPAD